MSKKRQKKKKEKQVRISAFLHRSLKIVSAKNRLKISQLAEKLLSKSLKDYSPYDY